jgi:acyl carrier protein
MSVSEADIRTRLNQVFCQVFDDDSIKIHDAMTAKEVEAWDSLNHVNLVVATEKHFGIRFTTREVNALRNVGEFVALIGRKLAS